MQHPTWLSFEASSQGGSGSIETSTSSSTLELPFWRWKLRLKVEASRSKAAGSKTGSSAAGAKSRACSTVCVKGVPKRREEPKTWPPSASPPGCSMRPSLRSAWSPGSLHWMSLQKEYILAETTWRHHRGTVRNMYEKALRSPTVASRGWPREGKAGSRPLPPHSLPPRRQGPSTNRSGNWGQTREWMQN